MSDQGPTENREAHVQDEQSVEGRLRVLQVAGGNPAFAAKLREMLWREYHAAGCLGGVSKEGMFRWLMREEQSTHVQEE